MNAGALRHRITILTTISAMTNDIGEVIEGAPLEVATVWAAKWQLTAKDISRAAGQVAQAEAKFLIRHRDDITTQMTVQHKGVTYAITGLEDFEDGQGLFLMVRSMTA
ncbi:phage head closure protein [Sphingobium bisphenolivorans]|uniref:phage head closure protein n=1 Tax=Sphingobium bisphenolivorans TaxID=1335760 RepID=UPI0003B5BF8C|nr:phage head closure protein [Sphingobium bisphenolivorans]